MSRCQGRLSYYRKFYIFFFLGVTAAACFFPPSADDLGWATSEGLRLLDNGFKNYNGRYLGNIFAVVLTRIPYVLPVIKGAVWTGILIFIQKFTRNQNRNFLHVSALLLILPAQLFIQAFVWTAGFSNYGISVLITMACIYLLFFKHDLKGCKKLICYCGILVLGVAGQLFMEHFTIFSLMLAVCSVIYWSVKKKRPDELSIAYLLSCTVGAIIMFSNGIYLKVFSGGPAYQQIQSGDGSLSDRFINAVENLFGTVSLNGLLALFPVLLVMTALSIRIVKKNLKFRKTAYLLYGFSGAFLLAFLISYLLTKDLEHTQLFAGGFMFVWMSAECVVVRCLDTAKRKRIGIGFAALLFVTLPLSVVYPVGPRCFTMAMVIMLLVMSDLFETGRTENHRAEKITAGVLTAVFAVNLFCYTEVYFGNKQKIETIRTQVQAGNTRIELSHTKFRFCVYALDAENKNDKFMKRFCEYYDLPSDIEISYK